MVQPPPRPRPRLRVALLLAPSILASIVMAAHFVRFFVPPLVLFCVLLPLLLLVRRTWAVRVVQVVLVLGSFIWLMTAYRIMEERMLVHAPFLRMLAILGAVGVFTLVAALLLETPTLRRALRR